MRVLSLGAGRQSTALYLLACAGRFGEDRPEVAYFADTGAEPQGVYAHLERLERERGHIIPIERVSAGNLADTLIRNLAQTGGNASIPTFTSIPTFASGGGMGRRQCTREYKIAPIEKALRARLGVAPGRRVPRGIRVEQWMGISADEASRMRANRRPYITNRYPLAMELGWTAADCSRYVTEQGFTPAKSACVFCPYTDNKRWRELAERGGEDWALAIQVDEAIRDNPKWNQKQYLTRRLLPIAELVRLPAAATEPNLFENECEGVCSV